VSNYDTIVIEDLNVSGMIKNHKLAKSIADASFSEIRRQLSYKCEWHGKDLIVINRFYPSSKTCSGCGNVKSDLTLSDREYSCCECGLKIDRDLNASINILTVGITGLAC
jgi:putative transposase